MIQVIMGLKGSGKTKKLIDSINETVASAQGDVVCIEYGKQLTYDVNYRVRLVNAKEYGTAVFASNIRKTPNITKADSTACGKKDKAESAGELLALSHKIYL